MARLVEHHGNDRDVGPGNNVKPAADMAERKCIALAVSFVTQVVAGFCEINGFETRGNDGR